MIFYGYGEKTTSFSILNSTVMMAAKYIHIYWIIRITYDREWYLKKKDSNILQEISKKQAIELLGKNPVKIWWVIFNQSAVIFAFFLLI